MTGSISFATDIRLAQKQPRAVTVALGGVLALCPILFWQSDGFSINAMLSPAVSLTFWLAVSTIVVIQAVISTMTMQFLLRNPSRLVFWLSRLLNAMLNIALASVESIGLKHFWGLPIGEQHDLVGTTLIVAAPVVLVLALAERGIAVRQRPVTTAVPALRRPGTLKRMPRGVIGSVELLRAEDHYLNVHTASGAGMIKYRLSDAIHELGADTGLQVHKSWWVSYSAIRGIEKSNGRVSIVLGDGSKIPVSRTYLPKLQQWQGDISGRRP